jgi:hypothetical protein
VFAAPSKRRLLAVEVDDFAWHLDEAKDDVQLNRVRVAVLKWLGRWPQVWINAVREKLDALIQVADGETRTPLAWVREWREARPSRRKVIIWWRYLCVVVDRRLNQRGPVSDPAGSLKGRSHFLRPRASETNTTARFCKAHKVNRSQLGLERWNT